MEEVSKKKSEFFGTIPYIDPKKFDSPQSYSLNKKSDIYSIGVLLWEMSSGKPPFNENTNKISLIYDISQGKREEIIPDTPNDYAKLYTGNYDFNTVYCCLINK